MTWTCGRTCGTEQRAAQATVQVEIPRIHQVCCSQKKTKLLTIARASIVEIEPCPGKKKRNHSTRKSSLSPGWRVPLGRIRKHYWPSRVHTRKQRVVDGELSSPPQSRTPLAMTLLRRSSARPATMLRSRSTAWVATVTPPLRQTREAAHSRGAGSPTGGMLSDNRSQLPTARDVSATAY